jgi:hypothetical protein
MWITGACRDERLSQTQMNHPFTRPTAAGEREAKRLSEDTESRHKKDHHQSMTIHHESGFAKFVGWCGVICAALVTAAIIWIANSIVSLDGAMIGVQKDIAALLSRPQSVPRDEYSRDMENIYRQLDDLKRQIEHADKRPR